MADGRFDAEAISPFCGAAAMLLLLAEQKQVEIKLPELAPIQQRVQQAPLQTPVQQTR